MKVAIYGGSFNPIHEGHLSVAKQALNKGIADEVWFMPTAFTPLKLTEMASSNHRVQMIKRAISPFDQMKLCSYEVDRDITSYTMDTVYYLLERHPDKEFCWLIGEDQAKQFHEWKDYKVLLDTLDFYVFSRGEQQIKLFPHMYAVPMDLVDVSSTEIREGYKLHLCPKSVRNYLRHHNLYVDMFVKSKMSEYRYAHTKRVAYLCYQLASIHGVDQPSAYLAGLLHDVVKELDYNELKSYMNLLDPKYKNYAPAIWHGFVAPMYCRRHNIGINKEISNAIMHHVLGTGTTKLSKILYISDKIEPGRGYDNTELLNIATRDLELAFIKVKEEANTYLKEKGVIE